MKTPKLHSFTRAALIPAVLLAVLLTLAGLPAAAATYEIDGVHSSAIFKIKHFGTSNFYGAFKEMSGTVVYDAENPSASSVDVTIQSASVDSRNGQRDGHITSPDFLNAKQFPTITFKSTKVSGSADSLEVTGNLTLNGVTKEVIASVEKTGSGTNPRSSKEIIGFEATFTVDRTAHDMSFMAGPLGEEIGFILSVEAVKQ